MLHNSFIINNLQNLLKFSELFICNLYLIEYNLDRGKDMNELIKLLHNEVLEYCKLMDELHHPNYDTTTHWPMMYFRACDAINYLYNIDRY